MSTLIHLNNNVTLDKLYKNTVWKATVEQNIIQTIKLRRNYFVINKEEITKFLFLQRFIFENLLSFLKTNFNEQDFYKKLQYNIIQNKLLSFIDTKTYEYQFSDDIEKTLSFIISIYEDILKINNI